MASGTPALRLPSKPQGPLIGIKLYCSVTEAHVCKQLDNRCFLKAERPGIKPAPIALNPNDNPNRNRRLMSEGANVR